MRLAVLAMTLAALAVAFGLAGPAAADTAGNVTITATTCITSAPRNFTVTYINDHVLELSWTKAAQADNTLIRRGFHHAPGARDEGYLVYYGNGTSCTDTGIDLNDPGTVFYSVWGEDMYGNWSSRPAHYYMESPGMQEIATGITGMGDLVALLSYFVLPLLCAVAYQWRGSIIFAVPGALAACLALPYLADYGWHFAAPVLVLALFIMFKLLYQAWSGGIKI